MPVPLAFLLRVITVALAAAWWCFSGKALLVGLPLVWNAQNVGLMAFCFIPGAILMVAGVVAFHRAEMDSRR